MRKWGQSPFPTRGGREVGDTPRFLVMNEDKSARYHRLKRRADLLAVAWSTALLVFLLASGWMRQLRDLAVGLSDGWPGLAVIWSVIALFLLHELGSLPIAWYAGFALERRYGMARQGSRDWLLDHLKGSALGLGLALMLATIVYGAMRAWPTWWWLAAAAMTSALIIVLANLAPVLLLPLFFHVEPLDRPSLRMRLEDLARRAGARVVGVFRWDLGAKTSKANAALTGIGSTRRILIADTMLDHYSEDEIEVVLAHELAHHVHHDIWSGIALETVLVVAGFALAHGALVWLGPGFRLEGIADPAGLPLLLLAAGAVSLALLPVALALSRRHERRADRFALDLTRNPAAFASAMRRLGAQNLAEEQPSRIVQWLFYSHPPLAERLEAASRWRAAV
jgi:STE24 endopeptidase